jgi:hypothetical protein
MAWHSGSCRSRDGVNEGRVYKILLVSSSRRIAADTVEQVQSQVQSNTLSHLVTSMSH